MFVGLWTAERDRYSVFGDENVDGSRSRGSGVDKSKIQKADDACRPLLLFPQAELCTTEVLLNFAGALLPAQS